MPYWTHSPPQLNGKYAYLRSSKSPLLARVLAGTNMFCFFYYVGLHEHLSSSAHTFRFCLCSHFSFFFFLKLSGWWVSILNAGQTSQRPYGIVRFIFPFGLCQDYGGEQNPEEVTYTRYSSHAPPPQCPPNAPPTPPPQPHKHHTPPHHCCDDSRFHESGRLTRLSQVPT
jgi:hypothetical protein